LASGALSGMVVAQPVQAAVFDQADDAFTDIAG
jgi:hypothetical protein